MKTVRHCGFCIGKKKNFISNNNRLSDYPVTTAKDLATILDTCYIEFCPKEPNTLSRNHG
ncbi:MAG: hypothetical protein NZL83_03945 [Candidatus Absconditabacterales bacterium]|nr:hypothetical protein [Candidatus Absconditabacterales bacterium]